MLGATVMPHVVYLHSALTRDRFGLVPAGDRRRRVLAATRTDVVLAMLLAGTVNISMLLLAASALGGQDSVDTHRRSAHRGQRDARAGHRRAVRVGLLASGLASTSVGCYAGSVIMAGLLRRRIPLLVRRVVTLIPALIVLGIGADPTTVLILSQVVLSFGLPLVLIPLVRLTGLRSVMGDDASGRALNIAGWAIAAAVSALNVALIVGVLLG